MEGGRGLAWRVSGVGVGRGEEVVAALARLDF